MSHWKSKLPPSYQRNDLQRIAVRQPGIAERSVCQQLCIQFDGDGPVADFQLSKQLGNGAVVSNADWFPVYDNLYFSIRHWLPPSARLIFQNPRQPDTNRPWLWPLGQRKAGKRGIQGVGINRENDSTNASRVWLSTPLATLCSVAKRNWNN
jgi:hypothetical protein